MTDPAVSTLNEENRKTKTFLKRCVPTLVFGPVNTGEILMSSLCLSPNFLALAATKHGHIQSLKYLDRRTNVECAQPQP